MDDRQRVQTPSGREVFAFIVMGAALMVLSSLAVERWGVLAFVLILVAMVAALIGLVATGWLRRKGEGMWMLLVLAVALPTSEMVQVLGVPLWGSILIGNFIVIAGWLVVSQRLPWWQSRWGGSRR